MYAYEVRCIWVLLQFCSEPEKEKKKKKTANCRKAREMRNIDRKRNRASTALWLCNVWSTLPHTTFACEIIIIKYSVGSMQMTSRAPCYDRTYSTWLALLGETNIMLFGFFLHREEINANLICGYVIIIINNVVGRTVAYRKWPHKIVQFPSATILMPPFFVGGAKKMYLK